MTTMKIKEIIVPVIENCEPFDLRASFGHLRMKAQAVEQEEARLDALVLNRRRIAWVAAWLEAHRERRPFRFIIWWH